MIILFTLLILVVAIILIYHCTKYDDKGFDRKGYDKNGYNRAGYNRQGYNRFGKNVKGQYNRLFDAYYREDGFRNPQLYPIGVTNHARERMMERMHVQNVQDVNEIAFAAYCFGRSKRQIKKSSMAMIAEIESRHNGSVLLLYRGYVYVFSDDNKLITVYKNERIPL